jgi:UDP-GlcNAc:undecaprenyl-phosphate GlcNAc-1-phosphate transferase
VTVSNSLLYLFTFAGSLILSAIFVPSARAAAQVLNIFDRPHTAIKTHKEPVPYLGGVAILLAFGFALLWVRGLTSFPTGTLRSLRGVLCGAALLAMLGLIDDVKHGGLHYRTKFLFQLLSALIVMSFGIRIKFINPPWFAKVLTLIWIVGLTNAFNLIDIMDGLASGIAFVAGLAFLFISLPTEEIYVNLAAAALCGATLGFFPYNLSRQFKIFMGDSGSLMLGFVCSSLALGTSYSYGSQSRLAVLSPLLILALPIFDTCLVSVLRIRRGKSPFVGSKDHFPLRLEALGWKRPLILFFTLSLAAMLSSAAMVITRLTDLGAIGVFAGCAVGLWLFTLYILRAHVS